jgi:hypothetical protein
MMLMIFMIFMIYNDGNGSSYDNKNEDEDDDNDNDDNDDDDDNEKHYTMKLGIRSFSHIIFIICSLHLFFHAYEYITTCLSDYNFISLQEINKKEQT